MNYGHHALRRRLSDHLPTELARRVEIQAESLSALYRLGLNKVLVASSFHEPK